MTAFRRGKRWCAKYVRQGRQVWVPGGPWQTKQAALDAEHAHRRRRDQDREQVTCAEWAARWTAEWPRQAASTRRLYEWAAGMFAARFAGRPVRDVTRLEARSWALTVPRKAVTVLGTMFEDARDVGLVESNPFAALRLPSQDRARKLTVPTVADLDRLSAACRVLGDYAPEFAGLVEFAAWTAVRQGELFALRWQDIDGDEAHVTRSQRQDGTYGPPKNGEVRTVALLPPALKALEAADGARRPDGLLWHAVRGGRLTKANHAWPWQKVRAHARLDTMRWHDLRHFAASQLLNLGLSPYDASLHLGHTDGGRLVVERYGHPDHARVRRRIRAAYDLGVGDLLPADPDPDEARSGSGGVA